jgi:hypothetical protein
MTSILNLGTLHGTVVSWLSATLYKSPYADAAGILLHIKGTFTM